jgi:hypothetical protein
MKRFLFSLAVACFISMNTFAANWVTVTTAAGNVFHVNTEIFKSTLDLFNWVWNMANAVDQKYPDGTYRM